MGFERRNGLSLGSLWVSYLINMFCITVLSHNLYSNDNIVKEPRKEQIVVNYVLEKPVFKDNFDKNMGINEKTENFINDSPFPDARIGQSVKIKKENLEAKLLQNNSNEKGKIESKILGEDSGDNSSGKYDVDKRMISDEGVIKITEVYRGNELISRSYRGPKSKYEADKNETTYYESLRTFLSEYYTNDRNHEIRSTLIFNRNVRKMFLIEFTIDDKGRFNFTNIAPYSNFRDRDNRALRHYKEFFERINNEKFIPPKECNMKAPYVAKYYLINPVYNN